MGELVDANAYLVELSGSERTDFGRVEFPDQSPHQRAFTAIWALEGEVNGGGFASYFGSWDGDSANFAPVALELIGATNAAAIVRRALEAVSVEPLPDDYYVREALIEALSESQVVVLDGLDSEFMSYPDNLTELLFAFVAARPEVFGPVPDSA